MAVTVLFQLSHRSCTISTRLSSNGVVKGDFGG